MATIINEISFANSKGELTYKFSVSQDKKAINLESLIPQNNNTDIFIEIPIKEWNEIVEYVKKQVKSSSL